MRVLNTMNTETIHIPVLFHEVLENLNIQSGDTVLDGTVGGGGHAEAICKIVGPSGTFIGLDQDTDALARSQARLSDMDCKVILRESNFRNLDKVLEEENIETVDKALFDLGWSSDQMADPERGMSFQIDSPLTMTLKKSPLPTDVTAFDVVNDWQEETIADVIYAFGDERYARRIAKAIIEAREEKPVRTTAELVDIIRGAVPVAYRRGRINPATKTFQALRIVVNDEYGAIKEALEKVLDKMKSGSRIAVITFHSGEDRIIKEFFKEKAKEEVVVLLHKKPIAASEEEIKQNRRSRSAKLRTVEKI